MSNRRTTADRLMGQIYLWIFKAEQFAVVLKKEAKELESAPKQCKDLTPEENIVLGLLKIPYSHIFGPLSTAITALTSGASTTSDILKSKLQDYEIKSQKSQEIGEKVQQLNTKLRSQSQCNNTEDYVLFKLLKSLGKLEGLTGSSSTGAMKQLMNNFLKSQLKDKKFENAMANFLSLLQFFDINTKQYAAITGGLVGLSSSLLEDFGNCQKALNKNDGAKAVEILRDISDPILKATDKLSELSHDAQTLLAQAVRKEESEASGGGAAYAAQDVSGSKTVSRTKSGPGSGGTGTARKPEEKDSDGDEEEVDNADDEEEVDSDGDEEEEDSDKEEATVEPRQLCMALLNVHSIKKEATCIRKGKLIKNLILNHKLDFFLFTETWLTPGRRVPALRSLLTPNLNFIHRPRRERPGGGVAIAFSNKFDWIRVDKINFNTFECVAASFRHQTWNRPILILTVYRPPKPKTRDAFNCFIQEFRWLLFKMSLHFSSIIVAGDFNIWIDDPQKRESREFLQTLEQLNLEQFVHEPTRGVHTLDLVIGRPGEVTNVRVNDDNISDHSTVYFQARTSN